ncbi:MAG TPA: hypothetical protein PLR06_02885 [Cyclobacteriaceae bacterium]|nr:hypothetical protein [Cyclobacteriaceae bacterium]
MVKIENDQTMVNKVVLSVLQNVLSVNQMPLNRNTNFKSMGATPIELNWIMYETERRLRVELPEIAITPDSTIKDLIKTVVVNRAA